MEKTNLYILNQNSYNQLSNNEVVKRKFNIFFEIELNEKSVLKKLSKEKNKHAVILNKNNEVSFVYRKNGTWIFANNNFFDIYFSFKLGIVNLSKDKTKNRHILYLMSLENLNENSRINFNTGNIDVLLELIHFYTDPNWKKIISNFNNLYGFYSLEKKQYNIANSKNVINAIGKKVKLIGLPVNEVFDFKNDEEVTFKNRYSLVRLSILDNKKAESIIVSKSDDEVSLYYNTKGTTDNLNNHILNLKTSIRKLSTREIIFSIIGFIIFIIMIIVTFMVILKPENVSQAVSIFKQKETYMQPWLYLLWMNFFINYFFSLIVASMAIYFTTGKMPNWKTLWTVFIGRQLNATTRFITGEAIIGTIIMAWYIAKESNIRVSSYVGTIATISIIKIPLTILLVMPFMISGQLYANQLMNSLSSIESIQSGLGIDTSLFYILSWSGFAWSIIHHSITPIVILLPPAHYLYNLLNTKYSIFKRSDNLVMFFTAKEMSLASMKNSTKRILKRKTTITRIAIMIPLLAIVEALEMMYVYQIVEHSMFNNGLESLGFNEAKYYNFIQLSGLRMMVHNIYECPVINITPGSGAGIVEYFLENVNEIIFVNKHFDIFALGDLDSHKINEITNSFAEQSAFLTRFFNVYLQRLISMIISIYIINKIFRRKLKGGIK